MAFDDGTPLDAAKLQALETEIANLKSKIVSFGESSSSTTSGTTPVVQPKIIGKALGGDGWVLNPGQNTFQVTFEETLPKTPNAIIVTSRKGLNDKWHPQVDIQTQTSSASGFTAICYMPSNAPSVKIFLSYIAICY